MSQVSATPQLRTVSKPGMVIASPAKLGPTAAAKTTPKRKKQEPAAKKVPNASQSAVVETANIAKLRNAIFAILQQHPEFKVKKRVIASPFGSCLRVD